MEKISYISWMFSLLVLCGFEVQAQSSDQVYFNRNDIKFSEVTENQTVYLINENELPEVVTSEDGTVDIDFGGGRIASIGVYTRINNQVRTTGRITEITCLNSTANSNCDISMGSIFRTHRLYWRRHPNPNKMGKQVKLKEYNSTVDNDPGSVPVQTFLFGSYEKNFHRVGSNFLLSQEELQQLNPVKFVCDNESWMTEINQYLGITSNEFVVNEWVTEAMEENRETGVNENRTDMGVFGVVFDILEDGGIQLKEFKYPFTQRENNMGALIAGDIVGMNLSADGKTCDVSMNINVEGLANQIFLDGEDDQLVFSPLQGSDVPKALRNFEGFGVTGSFPELVELFASESEMGKKLKILASLGILSYGQEYENTTISSANDFGDNFEKPIQLQIRRVRRPVD